MWHLAHVNVVTPVCSSRIVGSELGGVRHRGVGGGILASKSTHHAGERARLLVGIGRVDDPEHALLAMGGGSAVVERRVGVIDNLRDYKTGE